MKPTKKKQLKYPLFIALALLAGGTVAVGILSVKMQKVQQTNTTEGSPTLALSPTVTPAYPGWKVIQAKDMHFTIQYPGNLVVDKGNGYRIYYPNPKQGEYGFQFHGGEVSNPDDSFRK